MIKLELKLILFHSLQNHKASLHYATLNTHPASIIPVRANSNTLLQYFLLSFFWVLRKWLWLKVN